MKGTNKLKEHSETYFICFFDSHGGICQSERINVCEHTVKMIFSEGV